MSEEELRACLARLDMDEVVAAVEQRGQAPGEPPLDTSQVDE